LDKRTATYPKAKEYQKMKIAGMKLEDDEGETRRSDSEDRGEESDEEESDEEVSEGESMDNQEYEEGQPEDQEERNWWDSPSDSD
jgi:hypothetical protein